MAVECQFQALTLAEAQEELQAYEAQSHKSIQGRGRPKAMKLSLPRFVKAPIGLDYSPKEFQKRKGKNGKSNPYNDGGDYAPRQGVLDRNNSASSRQLSRRQGWNVSQKQSTDQSRYYSKGQ